MKKNKIVKILSLGLISSMLLASCNVKPAYTAKDTKAENERTVATNAQTKANVSNTNNSKPINTQSSNAKASNAQAQNVPLDLPLPSKDSVSGKALDKYVEGLKATKSDKTSLKWKIEDGEKKSAGLVTLESMYEEGAPTLVKGNDKNFISADSEEVVTEVDWYKTQDKVIIYEDGAYKEYKLSELENFGNFEISALITRALSFAEATEDDKDYVVVVETSDKVFIKELMGYLSYIREDENAWNADLTMEITIDKETGHLKTINYIATNKDTKRKDSGEIVISSFNEVEEINLPEIGQTGENKTTTKAENNEAQEEPTPEPQGEEVPEPAQEEEQAPVEGE